MSVLRDYQHECIAAILKRLKSEQDALVVLPTGSGKTIIFAEILSRVTKKTLVIVDKVRLIKQTKEKISREVGIYNADDKNLNELITIGTIQSLVRAKDIPKFNLIILDEMHRFDFNAGMFKKFIQSQDGPKIIGFTATPFSAREYLYGPTNFFKEITYQKTFNEMTDRGFLVPLHYGGSKRNINLVGVKTQAGDYCQSDLEKNILADIALMKSQVEDALQRCIGKTVWICVTIEHAEKLKSLIPNSICIHSQNNQSTESFERGDVQHCVSVMMLSEGIDIPIAQTLVLMRPTRSPRLYVQAVGRILRPHQDKAHALLLDYGGVVQSLGDIGDIKINEKKSLRFCVHCEMYSSMAAIVCVHCGKAFETMCPECLNMKPLGESCAFCEKKQKEIDRYKSLTSIAFDRYPVVKCTMVKASIYSKNNIDMLKVDYWSGLRYVASEYLDERNSGRAYFYHKWIEEHTRFEDYVTIYEACDMQENILIPVELKIDNSNKWATILEKIYG